MDTPGAIPEVSLIGLFISETVGIASDAVGCVAQGHDARIGEFGASGILLVDRAQCGAALNAAAVPQRSVTAILPR
jgi:hypothetical protein